MVGMVRVGRGDDMIYDSVFRLYNLGFDFRYTLSDFATSSRFEVQISN